MQRRLVLAVLLLSFLSLAWSARAQPVTGQFDLTSPTPAGGAFFGSDVAISADGNTVLVGESSGNGCLADPATCGAAYVFVRQGTAWTLETTLTAPETDARGFGQSVALSGDGNVAMVAAPLSGCPPPALLPNNCGEVFAFVRTGGMWTFEKRIQKTGFRTEFDEFGFNMALTPDGSKAVIASQGDGCIAGIYCGAGYVYDRAGGSWNLEATLQTSPNPRREAGAAAAITSDGNTVLLGTLTERAFVFTRSGGAWSQTAEIPSPTAGPDGFGWTAALSADGATALIGAPQYDGDALHLDSGAVYAFVLNGGTWTLQQRVEVPGGAAGSRFGDGLALSADGTIALVLASLENCGAGGHCAGIYEIVRQGGTWSVPQRLFSLPPQNEQVPAAVLALSALGRTGIVGIPTTPCAAGADCGSARVFDLALALDVPALGGPGLALLTLALIVSALVLLRRRRAL